MKEGKKRGRKDGKKNRKEQGRLKLAAHMKKIIASREWRRKQIESRRNRSQGRQKKMIGGEIELNGAATR